MRARLLALVIIAAASAGRAAERASGADLLGAPARPWHLVEWDGAAPATVASLRGKVLVVRFWTNTCPYCARSLPALQALADDWSEAPVQVLGIYHSKPRGTSRPWKDAVARARALGVTFPIAYDRDWKTVDSWWLDGRADVPTSATFVIDPAGTITYVHPGPELHPSADPEHADCDRAYRELRQAVASVIPKR